MDGLYKIRLDTTTPSVSVTDNDIVQVEFLAENGDGNIIMVNDESWQVITNSNGRLVHRTQLSDQNYKFPPTFSIWDWTSGNSHITNIQTKIECTVISSNILFQKKLMFSMTFFGGSEKAEISN